MKFFSVAMVFFASVINTGCGTAHYYSRVELDRLVQTEKFEPIPDGPENEKQIDPFLVKHSKMADRIQIFVDILFDRLEEFIARIERLKKMGPKAQEAIYSKQQLGARIVQAYGAKLVKRMIFYNGGMTYHHLYLLNMRRLESPIRKIRHINKIKMRGTMQRMGGYNYDGYINVHSLEDEVKVVNTLIHELFHHFTNFRFVPEKKQPVNAYEALNEGLTTMLMVKNEWFRLEAYIEKAIVGWFLYQIMPKETHYYRQDLMDEKEYYDELKMRFDISEECMRAIRNIVHFDNDKIDDQEFLLIMDYIIRNKEKFVLTNTQWAFFYYRMACYYSRGGRFITLSDADLKKAMRHLQKAILIAPEKQKQVIALEMVKLIERLGKRSQQ